MVMAEQIQFYTKAPTRTWAERIEDEDLYIHQGDAGRWNVCAVGETLNFPKYVHPDTIEEWLKYNHSELYRLGLNFSQTLNDTPTPDTRMRLRRILTQIKGYDSRVLEQFEKFFSAKIPKSF